MFCAPDCTFFPHEIFILVICSQFAKQKSNLMYNQSKFFPWIIPVTGKNFVRYLIVLPSLRRCAASESNLKFVLATLCLRQLWNLWPERTGAGLAAQFKKDVSTLQQHHRPYQQRQRHKSFRNQMPLRENGLIFCLKLSLFDGQTTTKNRARKLTLTNAITTTFLEMQRKLRARSCWPYFCTSRIFHGTNHRFPKFSSMSSFPSEDCRRCRLA